MNQYAAVGSLILDDIVLPEGQTRMAVLGGGGAHAASGMRVWSDQVALVSVAGDDFPQALWSQLQVAFDLRAVATVRAPTPRAWQLFERDGHRTEIFRTDLQQFKTLFTPRVCESAEILRSASGVSLLSGDPEKIREWVACLRARGNPVLLWEPWDIYMQPENRARFRELARLFEIVSPNLVESRRMTGEHAPEAVARALLDDGAKTVALRMGEAGSLIARADELIKIPALSFGPVVDVTGAGNAYCGGFLAGYVESGGNLTRAGMYGAVAASFVLSQFGVFVPDESARAQAQRRLAAQDAR